MRYPKSRFPIGITLFDELEFILFVNQGLTLSTASLDIIIIIICPGPAKSRIAETMQTAAEPCKGGEKIAIIMLALKEDFQK